MTTPRARRTAPSTGRRSRASPRSRPAPRRRPARRTSADARAPRELGFYGFTVRDVMTRKVVSVEESASLEAAAARMTQARVSGLPVVGRGGRVVGVVSQKDVYRLLQEKAGVTAPTGILDILLHGGDAGPGEVTEACRKVLRSTRVRAAMSRPAITIGPATTLDEAIGRLLSNRINRLPVCEGGRVRGIVTRHDLLTGVRHAI